MNRPMDISKGDMYDGLLAACLDVSGGPALYTDISFELVDSAIHTTW